MLKSRLKWHNSYFFLLFMIHYSWKCFLNNEKSSRMTFLTTSESQMMAVTQYLHPSVSIFRHFSRILYSTIFISSHFSWHYYTQGRSMYKIYVNNIVS